MSSSRLDGGPGASEPGHRAWLATSALVTSVSLHEGRSAGDAESPHSYDVGLRIQFEDGSTGFVSRRIGTTDFRFSAGDIVPVRYDPADRSHLEVDEAAWRALRSR